MYPREFAWFIQFVGYGLIQWSGLSHCTPIVGGKVVEKSGISRYSYVVSLEDRIVLENGSAIYKHFCGGSLISSSWILTAGHCVYFKNTKDIVAVIGYANLRADDVVHREVDAIELIGFVPSNLKNDIALVRLTSPVELDETKTLGLVPNPGIKASRLKPCKVIGYGATVYGGSVQDELNEADVYVISQKRCTSILGRIMAPQGGDRAVCALGDLQDSCQGDSGGPLICSVQGKDYIFGIVSHGLTCGQPGVPSIYTVTIPYKNWIDGVILGLNQTNYLAINLNNL